MKKTFLIPGFVILLWVSGCVSQTAPPEQQNSNQDEEYSIAMDSEPTIPDFAQDIAPFAPDTFTQAQMLEDYEFFWSVLQENCPLLSLVGQVRSSSMDSAQLKEFGRQKVLSLTDGDAEGFFDVMLYVTSQFHHMGHIGVISANAYWERMDSHNDENSSQLWNLYTDEKARAFYDWQIQLPLYQSLLDSKHHQGNSAVPLEPSLSFHQGIPVLKIPSFSGPKQQTIDLLKQFCLENIQAQHLILDLRGNSGGDTDIWLKGLSPLTQGKELVQTSLVAYCNTPYNRQIWGEEACQTRLDPNARPIEELPSALAQTENLNWDDLAVCDSFALLPDMVLRPEPGTKPLFQGNLWILTDSNVYSAAQAFVQFAQSSSLATIVGENTKGNGTLVMSPPKIPFLLPNSGIIAQYTPFFPLNPDGTCIELVGSAPDINVGQQDALEVCLREIKKEK